MPSPILIETASSLILWELRPDVFDLALVGARWEATHNVTPGSVSSGGACSAGALENIGDAGRPSLRVLSCPRSPGPGAQCGR